jgi:hypothetical protein
MKFERTWTGNWENAFHGLRHPMESYAKGDTGWYDDTPTNEHLCGNQAIKVDSQNAMFLSIGPNDMDLAQRMIKAGTPNDKFLRQIFVSIDITGPLYWWKEMDTYKVGTTANSTSTMHKLASTPITLECFEIDDFDPDLSVEYGINHIDGNTYQYDFNMNYLSSEIINKLERLRQKYLETKDIRYWKELIRWLPESWLQTRTWTADYSVLRNIYHWRKTHKLSEWRQFCNFIVNNLPYGKELIEFDN